MLTIKSVRKAYNKVFAIMEREHRRGGSLYDRACEMELRLGSLSNKMRKINSKNLCSGNYRLNGEVVKRDCVSCEYKMENSTSMYEGVCDWWRNYKDNGSFIGLVKKQEPVTCETN
jgi:hypothetical protein